MSQSLLNRAPARTSLARPAAGPTVLSASISVKTGRYLLGVWIMLAVLIPLCGFLGSRGFAPAVGFAGLLCLPFARPRLAETAGLILFGLLVEWAVISALWSPAPFPHTLHDIGRFTGLHLAQEVFFCGALIVTAGALPPEIARKALTWIGGGILVLIAVLLFEAATGAALFRSLQPLVGQKVEPTWALRSVNQGTYALAMLFWPVAVNWWRSGRWRLAAAFMAGAVLALILLHVAAPVAAFMAGAAVFALVAWLGRPAAIAGGAFAVTQSLAIPWLMRALADGGMLQSLRPRLPPSWAARIDIWTFTSARMAEKPVFGWGLDASRTFKGHISLHPHDGPVQLWFELGLPGAILGALIWAFIFWRFAEAARTNRLTAAAGCAAALSAMVISAFSFSLWQEWWICLVALAFACCTLLGRQLNRDGAHA